MSILTAFCDERCMHDTHYLLAFLSIISETDELDFQMGRTRSCVSLRRILLVRETLIGEITEQYAQCPISATGLEANNVAP